MTDWIIYKITNPEGYFYVGKTSDLKRRMLHHFNVNSQSNKYLKESLLKYPWEDHNVEVIDSFGGDDNYAQGKEMFWIRTLMANKNKWENSKGMNLTDGGVSIRGYKHTKESMIKSSQKQKGKVIPESQRLQIARTLAGKKQSIETKTKRAIGQQKAILQFDLNGNFIKEFNSIKNAMIELGYKGNSHVSSVCRGKLKSYKGFIFKYK